LILLLLASINNFSQSVILDSVTAKKVIVELIEGDYCKLELEQYKSIVSLTERKVDLQGIIVRSQEDLIDQQKKSIKKLENKNTFWKVAAIVSATVTGVLLVK
jgi:hypothetical protein